MRGEFPLQGNLKLYPAGHTPPLPNEGAANIYLVDEYLVVQWNKDGTAYYKYLDLSGTDGTWTHGTVLP